MDETQIFAKRLKAARIRAGFSQLGLGIQAGLDPDVASPRINRYEHGRHSPGDMRFVQKLATLLGVPMAYLFCPEEDIAAILVLLGNMGAEKRGELLKFLQGRQVGFSLESSDAVTIRSC
ncbi:MAG: helix-turn-helix transcriptional regulator [Magnetococcales bacterium]|nr:helix-turn-helix transcriptional regulator [Magnetococcales bacterium]NGZ06679.1 helix-turn-helix transcriptional regulator [Magnetococcales bacterium]